MTTLNRRVFLASASAAGAAFAQGNGLFHTIRFSRGPSWQPWGNIESVAGDLGGFGSLGCAELNGDLHVLATGRDNRPGQPTGRRSLHHAIRRTVASDWQKFNNVEATAAGGDGGIHSVATSQAGGDLHVVGLAWVDLANSSNDSKVVHTIRFTRKLAWQKFGNVTASRAGNPSRPPHYSGIACADMDGDLHVVVTGVGRDGKGVLFHTIRHTRKNDWQPFGNVNAAAAGSDKSFRGVACATVEGNLHLVAPDTQGVLWHAIRFTNQLTWQPFGNVSGAAGRPSARFKQATCAAVGGDLHVVGITTGNELLHTIRFSGNPGWQPFGSLSKVLGPFPQTSGSTVRHLACAGVAGDLHVCVGLGLAF